MIWLAKLGIIPKRLLQLVKPPPCAGCLTWKSTRRPWRVKGQQGTIKQATYCGECISVDQLDATTPGFVAQLKGILTRKRYRYATIFVDHFSDIDYVVPQTSLTSEETLRAKHSFEAWASSHNVPIKHYHADNGRFQDNAWKKELFVLQVIRTAAFHGLARSSHHSRSGPRAQSARIFAITIRLVVRSTYLTGIYREETKPARNGKIELASVSTWDFRPSTPNLSHWC